MTALLHELAHPLELLGFAAWAGPLLGWLTVAPVAGDRRTPPAAGPPDRPSSLVGWHRTGTVVLAVTSVLGAVLAVRDQDGLLGACALGRLALLLGPATLLGDLVRPPVRGARRTVGLAVVGALAVTLVLPQAVVQRPEWPLPTWAAGLTLLGLAGWVGALLIARLPLPVWQREPTGIVAARVRLVAGTAAVVTVIGAAAGLVATLLAPPIAERGASVMAAAVLAGTGVTGMCSAVGLRRLVGSRHPVGTGHSIGSGDMVGPEESRRPAENSQSAGTTPAGSGTGWLTASLALAAAVLVIDGLT